MFFFFLFLNRLSGVASTRLLQDPFKEIVVIWVILNKEPVPARISSNCKLSTQKNAFSGNLKGNSIFERASVVLLSDYALAVSIDPLYSSSSPVPVHM